MILNLESKRSRHQLNFSSAWDEATIANAKAMKHFFTVSNGEQETTNAFICMYALLECYDFVENYRNTGNGISELFDFTHTLSDYLINNSSAKKMAGLSHTLLWDQDEDSILSAILEIQETTKGILKNIENKTKRSPIIFPNLSVFLSTSLKGTVHCDMCLFDEDGNSRDFVNFDYGKSLKQLGYTNLV